MDEITADSRFSHILKDAKFRKLPKKHTKVKIDRRFRSMFADKKFNVKCAVDKRGRSVNVDTNDDLKRYYDVSESETDKEDTEDEEKRNTELPKCKSPEENNKLKSELKVSEKEKKSLTSQVRKKLKDMTTDYARGVGVILSESSSDEETSDEEALNEREFEHCWGELDKDAERTDEITSRLAVCNLDWDRIGAADLMVLFNSFLPKDGLIYSITIYPSEFGLKRMKEEEEKGPPELVQDTDQVEEDEESPQIQMEKIRQYQLNRLKYYYAVVVCNSPETADAIYSECDGLDYECSSSKLDLRFIPNDITFEQKPKETCTSLPDLTAYKPRYFVTSALTKAKVDLTWDETDVNRQEVVKSIHNGQIDENCLRKYLACSSSEDENENDNNEMNQEGTKNNGNKKMNSIEKYKALLAEVQSNEKESKKDSVNMEVTWNLDLEKKANELIKETVTDKTTKTPFQQYLDKRKQKRKQKKVEKLMKSAQNKDEGSDTAFSDDEIPSDIDLNDEYFREEMKSYKTNSKKKNKGRKENVEDDEAESKRAELELLMLDGESGQKHFNMNDIEKREADEKKRKKQKRKANAADKNTSGDNFKVDVNDERFSALYTSNYFNIDPADPAFRRTKGTEDFIAEKLKRRERQEKN